MPSTNTLLKFRRNCLFEGQLLTGDELSAFGSCFETGDVEEFRDVWHTMRESLDYGSIAVTGEYFDSVEDLLPEGVSALQHLDADGEELPCVGTPRIAKRRPNRWLILHETEADIAVVAWRVLHYPKGFYSYTLPPGVGELDLAEVELIPRDGLGDAPFFIAKVLFRGQPCELAHSEDGSGYSDCFAVHCWVREGAEWRRVWALDDGMGDDLEDWPGTCPES